MMFDLTRRFRWIAFGCACLSLAGCEFPGTAGSQSATATEETVELAESDITIVQDGEIGQTVRANGTLRAIQQSIVRAKVAGEIVAVEVREGERVATGQVLARIDNTEYAARVDDRRAALDAGRAQTAYAESTRTKNEELLQKNFISSLAYDNVKSAATIASSQMQSLEAHLVLAKKALDDTVVRAPIAGWVAERAVQRGDKTSPDGKLFTIVDLTRLELEALVPANEIARVATGQAFTAHVEGYADKTFTGHVARIGAQAASGSRMISIYIEIPNPDAALKAGLFAQGTLSLGRSKAHALVPLTALHSAAGVTSVYTIDNNHIRRVPVETGMQSEAEGIVDIVKGLTPGMRIVAVNLGPLKEGAAVSVASQARLQPQQ